MNRRRFLRKLGLGAAVMAGVPVIPCTACETCLKKCPQQIRIPNQMASNRRNPKKKITLTTN